MSSDSSTSADPPPHVLVDTSVAVAIVLADHDGHAQTLQAVDGLRLGLAGHAWFETYSVLTRMPPGIRRSPATVRSILEADFPETRFLGTEAASRLGTELAELGIAGGAVYDGLVGAVARAHQLPLLSRDGRARIVYERLGVDVRYVS